MIRGFSLEVIDMLKLKILSIVALLLGVRFKVDGMPYGVSAREPVSNDFGSTLL